MLGNEREQAERRATAACAALGLGTLIQDGKISEAVSISNDVVGLDPDSAWGHAIRARLHARVGLFKDAIAAFRTAFEFAKREDNAEVLRRICQYVLEAWQLGIDTLGESKKPDYTGGTMDTAAAILAARAILSRVPPAERTLVVKALEENLTGGAAGGEGAGTDDPATATPRPETEAARETTGRATAEPRPDVEIDRTIARENVAAVEWPTEKWDKSDEKVFHRDHAIIAYLRRVWGPLLEQGVVVTRPILKVKDPEAYKALERYVVSNPLPHDLRILKDDDLRDLLATSPKQVVAAMRVCAG